MNRGSRGYTQWKKAVGNALRDEIEKRYGEHKQWLFAEKVGVSQGSISEIVNGISAPSAWTLKRLDDLGIDIRKLLRAG